MNDGKNPSSGEFPDGDELLEWLNQPQYEEPDPDEMARAHEMMTAGFEERAQDVFAKWRKLYPKMDLDAFRRGVNKEWRSLGPDFDGLGYQLDMFMMHLPDPDQDRYTDQQVSEMKLSQATKVITMYDPEVQRPLLSAIDILAAKGQMVSQLTNDEIRFMNLAANGRSPERESFYRWIQTEVARGMKPRVKQVLEGIYGVHDDMNDIAGNLAREGARLGTALWERDRTSDAPDDVKQRNFRDDTILVNAASRMNSAEEVIGEEGIAMGLDMVSWMTRKVLDDMDGPHKH